MNSKDNQTEQTADLRQRPEDIIRQKTAQSPVSETISHEELRKILHELSVHQLELEMQNEELRQSKLELHASQNRYFELYDLAPAGYCTISEQGMILEANLAAPALLGMGRNELVEHPFSRFILQTDQDIYYRCRQQLMENGEPQMCELRMLKKDGTAFWVHLAISVAQDTRGNAEVRAVLSDITDRKLAEENLRQKDIELQCILNATADGILAVDRHGKVITMNHRFADLWHIPQVILDGGDDQTMLNYVLAQLSAPDAFLKKVQALYDSVKYDMDILDFKDGRVFERYSVPLMLESALIGRVWSFRDITERKHAEEALRMSETRLQKIISNTQAGYFFIDRDGLYQRVNDSWLRMHGYDSPDEVIGRPFTLTQVDTALEDARKIMATMLAGDTIPAGEFSRRCRDGSIRYHTFSAQPVVEGGKIVGIEGFIIDATDRKQAELEI